MKDRDPRRFLDADDTPTVLRDALAAARARAPSDAALAQLAARLPKPGGGSSGGAPKAPPVASGSALSGAAIGAALGVLVAAAGSGWQALHEAPAPPSEAAAAAVTAPLASSTASAASPAPVASAGSRGASPPAANAARGIERPSIASATPDTTADPEAPVPVPVPPATASVSAPAALVADTIDTETEAHFLDRARAALAGAPAQALSLTDEHARRFPGGALGQESEVVAIQALSRLGRADEARARAQRFLAAFPGSVHRRRLEALISPR